MECVLDRDGDWHLLLKVYANIGHSIYSFASTLRYRNGEAGLGNKSTVHELFTRVR